MPEDLPVVASLADLQAVQAEIEVLKVQVAELLGRIEALEALAAVEMPADVKTAFVLFMDWVKANV